MVAQLLPQIDLAAVAQPDSHKTEEEAWLDAVESGNLQVISRGPPRPLSHLDWSQCLSLGGCQL